LRLQIEFYFSDSNLPRDAFLLSAVEEAPDGFVSLALICTFSRMRTLLELKGSEGAPLTAATVSTHQSAQGPAPPVVC
jgi:La domain